MEEGEATSSSLRVELAQSSTKHTDMTTEGFPVSKTRISVIHVPLKVDIKALTSMKDNCNINHSKTSSFHNNTNEDYNTFYIKPTQTSTSDSGFGQSELDQPSQHEEDSDSVLLSSRSKMSETFSGTHHVGILGEKTFVQTINVDLDVPDKSTEPDTSNQRFTERNLLAQKITENLNSGGTPRNIQLKEKMKQPKRLHTQKGIHTKSEDMNYGKMKRDNSKTKQSKKELQWMDLHKNQMQEPQLQPQLQPLLIRESRSSDYSSVEGNEKYRNSRQQDWEFLERQLHHLQLQGCDADMALMILMSSYNTSENDSERLDWRQIAMNMGKDPENGDFFSVYPWSMRKKDQVVTRLGDYLQHCVHENQVTRSLHEDDYNKLHGKPPKGNSSKKRQPGGPIGIKYTKTPRGFAQKNDKSKTPGEVAIDEARYKNSKMYRVSENSKDGEEFPYHKPKTSQSLPNISLMGSASSSRQGDDNIHLPLIQRTGNTGKIYSGIYRLVTPPNHNRNAPSIPSLHTPVDHEESMSPLQVKNYTMPSSESFSFSSMLKHRSDHYQLPFIDSNGKVSVRHSFDRSILNPQTNKQKTKQAIILQKLHDRHSKEPPKPPPVTPNVRRGRTMMTREEMAKYSFVHTKPQTPLPSRRSSYNPANYSESEDDSVDSDDVDRSSIHSLSSDNE